MGSTLRAFPFNVVRAPGGMRSAPLVAAEVRVVVPVKDDLEGLARTLSSLGGLQPAPREVIVVDGSRSPPSRRAMLVALGRDDVRLEGVTIRSPPGPAAARNAGLAAAPGWVYFTDAGCAHPRDLLARFAAARRAAGEEVVAMGGPVVAAAGGAIARYMTEEGVLVPPMEAGRPQALVTANAMVYAPAARRAGGFDESFPEAGGEDLDLGLRLRRLGALGWVPEAVVRHAFREDLADFDARFLRYGRALRRLERKWGVRLEPVPFAASSPGDQHLADREYRRLLEGYRGALDPDALRLPPRGGRGAA